MIKNVRKKPGQAVQLHPSRALLNTQPERGAHDAMHFTNASSYSELCTYSALRRLTLATSAIGLSRNHVQMQCTVKIDFGVGKGLSFLHAMMIDPCVTIVTAVMFDFATFSSVTWWLGVGLGHQAC